MALQNSVFMFLRLRTFKLAEQYFPPWLLKVNFTYQTQVKVQQSCYKPGVAQRVPGS